MKPTPHRKTEPNADAISKDPIGRAPESGEPTDHVVKSAVELERTQARAAAALQLSQKDDIRTAPESGR